MVGCSVFIGDTDLVKRYSFFPLTALGKNLTVEPLHSTSKSCCKTNVSTNALCSGVQTCCNSTAPLCRKFSQSICHIGTLVEVQFIAFESWATMNLRGT